MKESHPIPARLNLGLALIVVTLGILILWGVGQVKSWWAVSLLSLVYGLVMQTAYALGHEAEHDIFHPRKRVNDLAGAVMGIFFPAAFHLRRQGHIGHHLRNRSDDEAFDLCLEGESAVWKWFQYYGILTGFFWLVIVLSNIVAVLNPSWLLTKELTFDRATSALQQSLNPKYLRLIRLEAIAIITLHVSMCYLWKIPPLRYAAVLSGFGLIWSTLQYIHHYGTSRDVQKGARNIRVWRIFDLLWLNHHWHLNHHISQTVPWIYLPGLHTGKEFLPSPFLITYWKMWKPPRPTNEHVVNCYAGKIIR